MLLTGLELLPRLSWFFIIIFHCLIKIDYRFDAARISIIKREKTEEKIMDAEH